MIDMILLKFLAQGAPVDAKAGGSSGLVVIAMPQYGLKHRLLDFGDYGIEQITGKFSIEIIQVFSNRLFYRLL